MCSLATKRTEKFESKQS